jgi:hypothetical protein
VKKVALIFAGFVATAAYAQGFKWTDKDGRVQYGDAPPPGVDATRLKAPAKEGPAASAPAKEAGEKPLTPEAAFRKRQQETKEREEKDAKARAEAEAKRTNCDAAQGRLRELQSGRRMRTANAAGEPSYLDDEQRALEIERAQRSASDWCK